MPGLRDHFNPRARWKSAIASTRAIVRLHAGVAAKDNGANKSINPEIPSDDDEDDDLFPLPTSRKSNTSTSKLLAGEIGLPLSTEPIPSLPSDEVPGAITGEDRENEPQDPPQTQEDLQEPQPQIEQIVEDTSRMSIQTDDILIPGSYSQSVSQGDQERSSNGPTGWLPRWLYSKWS